MIDLKSIRATNEQETIDALNYLASQLQHKNVVQATLLCHTAIQLSEQHDYKSGSAYGFLNLGGCYLNTREFRDALLKLEKALELFEILNDLHGKASAMTFTGAAHLGLKQFDEGLSALTESLELAKKLSDLRLQSAVLFYLGDHALMTRQYSSAIDYLNEATRCAQASGSKDWLYQINNALSSVYSVDNNYEQALKHYQAYHETREGLFNELETAQAQEVILNAITQQKYEKQPIVSKALENVKTLNQVLWLVCEKGSLIEELQKQIQNLERQTHEDPLTGLYNRRHLETVLSLEFERARRYSHNLTVVMADIDNFKQINDKFSHVVGDRVLKAVGQILKNSCRRIDIVARYGGEEFVSIFPMTALDQGKAVCERKRFAVEEYPWHEIHPDLKVTISIGLTDNIAVTGPEKMILAADQKMYQAKQNGKNQVRY